jgi:hypothetical protein
MLEMITPNIDNYLKCCSTYIIGNVKKYFDDLAKKNVCVRWFGRCAHFFPADDDPEVMEYDFEYVHDKHTFHICVRNFHQYPKMGTWWAFSGKIVEFDEVKNSIMLDANFDESSHFENLPLDSVLLESGLVNLRLSLKMFVNVWRGQRIIINLPIFEITEGEIFYIKTVTNGENLTIKVPQSFSTRIKNILQKKNKDDTRYIEYFVRIIDRFLFILSFEFLYRSVKKHEHIFELLNIFQDRKPMSKDKELDEENEEIFIFFFFNFFFF